MNQQPQSSGQSIDFRRDPNAGQFLSEEEAARLQQYARQHPREVGQGVTGAQQPQQFQQQPSQTQQGWQQVQGGWQQGLQPQQFQQQPQEGQIAQQVTPQRQSQQPQRGQVSRQGLQQPQQYQQQPQGTRQSPQQSHQQPQAHQQQTQQPQQPQQGSQRIQQSTQQLRQQYPTFWDESTEGEPRNVPSDAKIDRMENVQERQGPYESEKRTPAYRQSQSEIVEERHGGRGGETDQPNRERLHREEGGASNQQSQGRQR